ncbi:MAG TPA: cyclic pyranopterin monophosphate synthase MoaC [Egibacteraceae bacterium]|nr:cyclic pyranopterin monophosphate synthase MoaC [Egibacteraceae bacterium]
MTAGSEGELGHLDERGRARMVDVGGKSPTRRDARARAGVRMSPDTARAIAEGRVPKGDALAVARVAGIMAAKRTSDLIPLCHPIALSSVTVDVEIDTDAGLAEIRAAASADDRTGVEMEALVAAATAALALYDMIKGLEREAFIERVELLSKTGGARGDWARGGPVRDESPDSP